MSHRTADGRTPRPMRPVRIDTLGGFDVTVEGVTLPARAWTRRHAAILVKLLALRPERRLHREQVLDVVWPDDPLDVARPSCTRRPTTPARSRASRTRSCCGGDLVQLFPDIEVVVDATEFERRAADALSGGDTDRRRRRAPALPRRPAARGPLRGMGRPGRASASSGCDVDAAAHCSSGGTTSSTVDPGDERAHLELMRRLRRRRRPSRRTPPVRADGPHLAPRARRAARPRGHASSATGCSGRRRPRPVDDDVMVGRETELQSLDRALAAAAARRCTDRRDLRASPASASRRCCGTPSTRPAALGWRVGVGAAASIEGAWPYAPVLDAARRPLPPPPRPARRPGRHVPGRDRPRPGRRRGAVDRATARTSGCSSPRPSCCGWRRRRPASLLAIDDLHDADEASLAPAPLPARALAERQRAASLFTRPHALAPPPTLDDSRPSLVGRDRGDRAGARLRSTPTRSRRLVCRHVA